MNKTEIDLLFPLTDRNRALIEEYPEVVDAFLTIAYSVRDARMKYDNEANLPKYKVMANTVRDLHRLFIMPALYRKTGAEGYADNNGDG